MAAMPPGLRLLAVHQTTSLRARRAPETLFWRPGLCPPSTPMRPLYLPSNPDYWMQGRGRLISAILTNQELGISLEPFMLPPAIMSRMENLSRTKSSMLASQVSEPPDWQKSEFIVAVAMQQPM